MNHQIRTVSFCTNCYAEIPATISIHLNGVWMDKTCARCGTPPPTLVERDPIYYQRIRSLRSPSIYPGYFVDVTRACNLRCDFCYYALEKEADPEGQYSIASIVSDCKVNAHRAPFILTGGEPTTRKDIVELISAVSMVGTVSLLSNGVRLADRALFDSVMPLITHYEGSAKLNLSLHLKETDAWKTVIEHCRETGVTLESALIVINSEEEFHQAVDLAESLSGVVTGFRIKAASKIWNEQKPADKIFVSDMWRWLDTRKHRSFLMEDLGNKVSFVNLSHGSTYLMLVSWHETSNVDLIDINCAPHYRARNGEIANMVTAMLINEGMEKGWMKGRSIAP